MISLGGQAPHVLRAHMGHTCGEPNEVELAAIGVKLDGSRHARSSPMQGPRSPPRICSHELHLKGKKEQNTRRRKASSSSTSTSTRAGAGSNHRVACDPKPALGCGCGCGRGQKPANHFLYNLYAYGLSFVDGGESDPARAGEIGEIILRTRGPDPQPPSPEPNKD